MVKKALKPTDFKSGWRRKLAVSDKPVTLSRAPWEQEKEAKDDRKSA